MQRVAEPVLITEEQSTTILGDLERDGLIIGNKVRYKLVGDK